MALPTTGALLVVGSRCVVWLGAVVIVGTVGKGGHITLRLIPPASWWQRLVASVRLWLVRGFWLAVAFSLGRVWEMVS